MSFELQGYEKDHLGMKSVLLYTFLGVASLLVSVIFISFYFFIEKESMYKKNVLTKDSKHVKEYKQYESNILDNYSVIDEQNNVYSMPITKAMAKVVLEYEKK